MQNLIIYGAGDLARLAYFYAKFELDINVIGFVVDDVFYTENQYLNLPVFAWSQCPPADQADMFIAIGYKKMRARAIAYSKAKLAGYQLVNLISPESYVANNVQMGNNNIIMSGTVIEPFVKIGDNNVIWSNATVCHDGKVGSHNFLAANTTIGGKVKIGNQCFFGFNSTVTQGLTVEDEVLLAAGSVALTSLNALSMYAGSPAVNKRAIPSDIGISIE